jgi:hypothetical protein
VISAFEESERPGEYHLASMLSELPGSEVEGLLGEESANPPEEV